MQEMVKVFNENKKVHTKQMPIYARLLDVQSEIGELSKEYLKGSKYGTEKFIVTDDFKLEFGDVLYSILSLANEVSIDAKEALNNVLAKYQKRIDDNSNMGSKNWLFYKN